MSKSYTLNDLLFQCNILTHIEHTRTMCGVAY